MKILKYLKNNILTLILIIMILIFTPKICDKIYTLSTPIYQNYGYNEPSIITNESISTTLSNDNETLIVTQKISLREAENNSKVYLSFIDINNKTAPKEIEMTNVGGLNFEGTISLPLNGYYNVDLLIKGQATTKSFKLAPLNIAEMAKEKLPVNLFLSITSSDNKGNFSYHLQGENNHKGDPAKKLKTLQASFYYQNEEILFVDLLKNGEKALDIEDMTTYKIEGDHSLKVVYGDNFIDDLNINLLAITEDGKVYSKTLKDPN